MFLAINVSHLQVVQEHLLSSYANICGLFVGLGRGLCWCEISFMSMGGACTGAILGIMLLEKICPSLHIAKSKTGFIIVTLLYSNMKYLYLCAKLLLYCFTNHHYLHKIKLFVHLSLMLISHPPTLEVAAYSHTPNKLCNTTHITAKIILMILQPFNCDNELNNV
jgi:hypothetical protein